MKTPFSDAQFAASAFKPEEFPLLQTPQGTAMSEIAFFGRSNVGKSSLINHLLHKKLAKTSSTPGKTQSLNFFIVDAQLALVDLPGYGFAHVSEATKKQWSHLVRCYLEQRQTRKVLFFLFDSRRTPTEDDAIFIRWAASHHLPWLLLLTKTDKLSAREKRNQTALSLETFQSLLPNTPIPFLHYSIKDPYARIELIKKIHVLLEQ